MTGPGSPDPCSGRYDPYLDRRSGPAPAIFMGGWPDVDAYVYSAAFQAESCRKHRAEQQKEKAYSAEIAATKRRQDQEQAAKLAALQQAARDRAEATRIPDSVIRARDAATQAAAMERTKRMPCGAGQVRDQLTGRCVGTDVPYVGIRPDPSRATAAELRSSVAIPGCLFTDITGKCVRYAPGYGPPDLQVAGWRDESPPKGAKSAPSTKAATSVAKLASVRAPTFKLERAMGLGSIIGGIGDFITGVVPGTLDDRLWGGVKKATGITPRTTVGTYTPPVQLTTGCPTGYVFRNGRCEQTGIGGAVARTVPGGSPGYIPAGGPATAVAALGGGGHEPAITTRRTCGPHYRLAIDGRCYPAKLLPAALRASPSRRAPVTHGDMKAINRASRTRKRLKTLSQRARK